MEANVVAAGGHEEGGLLHEGKKAVGQLAEKGKKRFFDLAFAMASKMIMSMVMAAPAAVARR